MRNNFVEGEQFLSAHSVEINNGVTVPEGTLFMIVEVVQEEMPNGYKVLFNGFDEHEETDWIRMSAEEIEGLRQSAMAEY